MAMISMVVLTHAEQMAALAAADVVAKEICKDLVKKNEESLAYDAVYNNEGAVQVLFRCCKMDNLTTPFFKGAKDIHARLTLDEIGILYREYLITQERLGPLTTKMSANEVDAWLDRLEKAGEGTVPLAFMSSAVQSELLMHLVRLLRPSPTDTISHGSPQDEPTSASNLDSTDDATTEPTS
jgi:hypothetical protein